MRDQLLPHLSNVCDMPKLRGAGVYILCLNRTAIGLPGIDLDKDRVLYVGMTEKDLMVRNHFHHRHSGGSTLRRSLGAILTEQLNLKPIRRDGNPRNADKYRFVADGEVRLTFWMNENIRAAQIEVQDNVRAVERALILELEPPLNLVGWNNPQKAFISTKRRACCDIVRASFLKSSVG